MSVEHPTEKQAAFLMRHLSLEDRNRMIAEAENVIDGRHWFAERDFAAYAERMAHYTTDGDIPA